MKINYTIKLITNIGGQFSITWWNGEEFESINKTGYDCILDAEYNFLEAKESLLRAVELEGHSKEMNILELQSSMLGVVKTFALHNL